MELPEKVQPTHAHTQLNDGRCYFPSSPSPSLTCCPSSLLPSCLCTSLYPSPPCSCSSLFPLSFCLSLLSLSLSPLFTLPLPNPSHHLLFLSSTSSFLPPLPPPLPESGYNRSRKPRPVMAIQMPSNLPTLVLRYV